MTAAMALAAGATATGVSAGGTSAGGGGVGGAGCGLDGCAGGGTGAAGAGGSAGRSSSKMACTTLGIFCSTARVSPDWMAQNSKRCKTTTPPSPISLRLEVAWLYVDSFIACLEYRAVFCRINPALKVAVSGGKGGAMHRPWS